MMLLGETMCNAVALLLEVVSKVPRSQTGRLADSQDIARTADLDLGLGDVQ